MLKTSSPAFCSTWSLLERSTIQGDSPVKVEQKVLEVSWVPFLDNGVGIWGALISKTKYVLSPIADKYCEGKLKRTLDGEFKVLKSSSYSMVGLLGVLPCSLNKVPGSVFLWRGEIRSESKTPQAMREQVWKCLKSQEYDPKPIDLLLGKVKRG